MLELIAAFTAGLVVAYIIYRVYRPMWVELGRIQAYISQGATAKAKAFDDLTLQYDRTTVHYTSSLSKFLIKHLRKGGLL